MADPAAGVSGWEAESREFALLCDPEGVILTADERARTKAGLEPGMRLLDRAVPGTADKFSASLQRAMHERLSGIELSLRTSEGLATCAFHLRPEAGGRVGLLGSLLPEDHGRSLRQMQSAVNEVLSLNRQVVRQAKELEAQKERLERTVAELADSNRGIDSLRLELEDNAEVLQRTAEVRSRVIANVSHEFRTPLHTILGLARLLLDGADGELLAEQRKQVQFIRSSAEELATLVDDLLDLASAEAGKVVLRPEVFKAADFVSALRGTMRPLVPPHGAVELQFGEPSASLSIESDRSKLSQILRNLVSNALKFTERGFVRVDLQEEGPDVVFRVQDTGIGIAQEHYALVFEEFGQIESALQSRVKGNGLGLPLSRRLAELLGGSLTVASEPGKGSTFTLRVPKVHPEVRELHEIQARPIDPARAPILVVEDDRKTIFLYEKYLAMAGFQVLPVRSISEAQQRLATVRPAAIVLDIMLDGESSWSFLGRLKADPQTRDIPVLVVTVTNKEQKARALGADEFWLKPVDQDLLLRKLRSLGTGPSTRVLLIDDDERARYLISHYIAGEPYRLIEATSGREGLAAARQQRPHVILLDFLLQDMTAFDVLDELKADPLMRKIPVIIVTSQSFGPEELQRLASHTEVILSKESLSRELALNRIRDALQKARASGALVEGGAA